LKTILLDGNQFCKYIGFDVNNSTSSEEWIDNLIAGISKN
jgi:hypothetical protein